MEINATLIGQFITFAVLVWFIMKYVWPPITKAMREREKKIAFGLEAAERGKRELVEAEHKALKMIRDAKKEAAELIDQAHKRANVLIEEAKDTAKEEGKRIVSLARDDITREVTQAKEGLRTQLAGLAVLGAEKILQRNLDLSAQKEILNQLVAEI